ncbi:hypothetical protein ACQWHW_25970, partial [Salmonella enterica subsp. enterica serovar Infantis]
GHFSDNHKKKIIKTRFFKHAAPLAILSVHPPPRNHQVGGSGFIKMDNSNNVITPHAKIIYLGRPKTRQFVKKFFI